MRELIEELSPFSGDIGKGNRLSVSLPPNTVYRSFFIDTNIPEEMFDLVELSNGSDVPMSLSGVEILMIENHNKRYVQDGVLPFHIADVTANTLPGQDSLERPSFSNDSHELRVRLSNALVPNSNYYIKAYASFTSNVVLARDEAGTPLVPLQLVPRLRSVERRFERFSINNVNKGLVVFDKLPRGPRLRALYIKGDISEIEVVCRLNGSIVRSFKITREINDYMLRALHDKAPQDGYFIFNAVASGFMADTMKTGYDELIFKIQNESNGQTIDILADIEKQLG